MSTSAETQPEEFDGSPERDWAAEWREHWAKHHPENAKWRREHGLPA